MMAMLLAFFGVKTIPGLIGILATTLGALTVLWVGVKKVVNKYRTAKHKANAMYDAISGSEAIIDPETGKVLKEATLPIGNRVAVIENAIVILAENQAKMVTIEETLSTLQKEWQRREKEGMSIIEEWTAWRNAHSMAKEQEHERLWEAIGKITASQEKP